MNPKNKSDSTNNLLGKIRKALYGVQPEKKLDPIDQSLARISTDALSNNSRSYAEMMQRAMNAALKTDDLNNITADIMTDIGTTARLARYISAEEVVDGISYCARALKVLKDGVISPDDITKETIQVLHDNKQLDESDALASDIRNIVKILKLGKMMDGVVYETLKLGDQFVEICDYTSEEVPITQTMLNEQTGNEEVIQEETHDIIIRESPDQSEEDGRKLKVQLELTYDKGDEFNIDSLSEINTRTNRSNKEKEGDVELKNIRLLPHDPRTVIKLQSKRYRMCLGYLVLPNNDGSGPAPGSGFNAPGAGGYGGSISSKISGLNSLMPSVNMVTGIDSLYKDLIKKVKKHFESNKKIDIKIDKKEIKELIARAVREIEDDDDVGSGAYSHTSKLNIRYVPVNRMQHFLLSSQRFFPYGESIFFKSILQCKFLIVLESSMTMKRLSDSIDRRIWYVEHGIPRDARNLIEELKAANKKKKFSIDNLGTISTIASQLTFNEDIYIPQSKGKRFVEPDVLTSHVDIHSMVEDLKYLRDEIVAGLEVPPAYLNLEENLSNKNALTFENILFAQTIISYQNVLSESLQGLIEKIYLFTRKQRIRDGVSVVFPPPKMLQLEKDAEKFDMIARIIQVHKDMEVDDEWAKRKYLNLPWEDIGRTRTDSQLDKKLNPPEEDNGMGGMGGIGSGGGLGSTGGY